MAIPYNLFVAAFLGKVTDYDFIKLTDEQREYEVTGYMKRACAQFSHVCKYDLTGGDDDAGEFDIDIPDSDIDEVVDIVSDGMCVQWFKQYLHRSETLTNVLNTADFSAYSPAELLYRVTNAYNTIKKDFTQRVREYSYVHGDLTNLAL